MTTYDHTVSVYVLSDSSDAMARTLSLRSLHYCRPKSVYHKTWLSSLQAGDAVDTMLELPRDDGLRSGMFAVPGDGETYRINEVQQTVSRDGLPVTVLSLHREETRYDII